jgi:hypothetical protein
LTKCAAATEAKNRGWTKGLELGLASIPHVLATDGLQLP